MVGNCNHSEGGDAIQTQAKRNQWPPASLPRHAQGLRPTTQWPGTGPRDSRAVDFGELNQAVAGCVGRIDGVML